jgi:hypothetical protein
VLRVDTKIEIKIQSKLDFYHQSNGQKHAKNTFFEHTPWVKVKTLKKAQPELSAWSLRTQITIGPGVANQHPSKNRLWKIHFFAAPKKSTKLTCKTRGNGLLGCDSVTQVAEIFTRVASNGFSIFPTKIFKIGGELHPLRGERQYPCVNSSCTTSENLTTDSDSPRKYNFFTLYHVFTKNAPFIP